MAEHSFDIDGFLAEPLTACLATNGPTLRPVWYEWEEGSFFIMSGPWTRLFEHVKTDPEIALVVDVCEPAGGRIMVVHARGAAEVIAYDVPRGRRMLHRYLGPDEDRWPSEPSDYRSYLAGDGLPGMVWLKLTPERMTSHDFSYRTEPVTS